jgi:NADH-quinone oxidoreductase subunit A
MYPWAVNFTWLAQESAAGGASGIFPIVEMGLFVAILFVGYIYIWKKGGLEWD